MIISLRNDNVLEHRRRTLAIIQVNFMSILNINDEDNKLKNKRLHRNKK